MSAVASGLDTTRSHLVGIRDASMPRAYGLLLLLLLLPARTTSIERALVSLSIRVLSWLDSPHGRGSAPLADFSSSQLNSCDGIDWLRV
ncbi:uncharacterized protein BO87DRAFT_15984 [Aspergillus neoniger CBS 115656]|uniref:Uncharacterized protein n=1 Tax=Aspergillus neoniger (strain CBS 115656) TaxID=1448310 RepID=A0A318Z734_ASPNB|nr:hypothetical protein BO87DRAFT_15984 [Aspergillus neoniger CBS 115656]PYH36038.1 hypothetical protein BO87DRAFT_15984 [Aspergillus neoniger CBS 115656]